MNPETEKNVKEENVWIRLVFVILFAIAMQIAGFVLTVTVVVQFLTKLLTGKVNQYVAEFGQNLAAFVYQVIRFLTFARDEMPWPFAPWPDDPPRDDDLVDAAASRSDVAKGPIAEAKG